jgi:quercetin dioxygenase-like cupin family protein
MSKQLIGVIGMPLLLLLGACSEPASETDADEQAAGAMETPVETMSESEVPGDAMADPTAVDPDHYMVEFENDAVRILRINYGPGEESVMHYHPDSVAVYMTDVDGQFTLPDGSVENASAPAGSAFFGPAGAHQPRNLGDSEFEVVEVEFKARQASSQEPDGADPTVVDADHYAIEFENDAVRVLRITYGPGEESVMHYHPDSVAVFVTDHLVEMTMPDGSTDQIPADAGDALFIPGGQHLPKNISDAAWELVLVELK